MIVVKTAPDFELNGIKAERTYLELPDADALRGMEIADVDWFAADFGSIEITDVTFKRCSLVTADFSRCSLNNVVFEECSLQGVLLPAQGYELDRCHTDFESAAPWVERAKPLLP